VSTSSAPQVWDVAVVGAGPAGATAARVAAEAGARVVLLEKATLPRYKTCGGGLIGHSRGALPPGFTIPARQHVDTIRFTRDGRRAKTRTDRVGDLLTLVNRAEFDQALTTAAVEAGACLREGAVVSGVAEHDGLAVLSLADGTGVLARAVIGADGSASRIGRYVGVEFGQVDLGLEAEIPVPPEVAAEWAGTVLIDWGPLRGSYGWVFPKGETLTVGVISARGNGATTRAYYRRLIERSGLAGYEPVHDSGHLTRCRTPDSPLGRGRVLVAGDAAGLLEPWTREGISFALRSGALAGTVAAGLATSGDATAAVADYRSRVEADLGREMASGTRKLHIYERHPNLVHTAISVLPQAWRMFAEFCRGPALTETPEQAAAGR
jgi:geranylgeranyl reductase family protein